jgi:hypothetical protein
MIWILAPLGVALLILVAGIIYTVAKLDQDMDGY